MTANDLLRVTITWSPNRTRISRVFVNGRSIEGLSLSNPETLQRYMAGLRGQGWRMLRKELSARESETYWFERKSGL